MWRIIIAPNIVLTDSFVEYGFAKKSIQPGRSKSFFRRREQNKMVLSGGSGNGSGMFRCFRYGLELVGILFLYGVKSFMFNVALANLEPRFCDMMFFGVWIRES